MSAHSICAGPTGAWRQQLVLHVYSNGAIRCGTPFWKCVAEHPHHRGHVHMLHNVIHPAHVGPSSILNLCAPSLDQNVPNNYAL
eukprot:1160642-Pelagomonas_calceolata.AAC.3